MPVQSSSVPSTGLTYHLSVLQTKVDEVVDRAGVSGSARLDLESCLAALPWRERRHLSLILQSVRVHANSPSLQDAVRLMQKLATQIWVEEPPPDLGRYQPSSYQN